MRMISHGTDTRRKKMQEALVSILKDLVVLSNQQHGPEVASE